MANEEVLRLRATVVTDEGLAKLRQLGREIGLLPEKARPGIKGLTGEFDKLGQTIRKMGGEITTVIPALGSVGLGAAGAAAAVGVLISTFGTAAKRIVELKYASKELGMSERDIRAWSSTAEKAGVSTQSMMSGMQAFKKTTDGLKYNIGGARDELYAMGAGPIVQRMMAATTQAEKMKVAFKFKDELMKDDPSGFKARMFFDQIGLGADKARLSYEAWQQAQAKLKPITPEDTERAQKYADSLVELGEAWDHLVTKAGISLFPSLTKDVENLNWLIEKLGEFQKAYINAVTPPPGVSGNLIDTEHFKLGFNRNAPVPKALGFGTEGPVPEAQQQMQERMEHLRKVPMAPQYFSGGGSGDITANWPQSTNIEDRRGAGGSNLSEFTRAVKEGVFAALVDFRGYAESGGAAPGGFQMASLGGAATGGGGIGAAPGGASPGYGGGGGGGGFNGGPGPNGQSPSAPSSGGGDTSTNLSPGSGGGTAGAPPASAAPAGSAGEVGPAAALAMARQHLGENEIRDQGKLQKFFSDHGVKVNPRTTAWCAGFVNANLNAAGIKGTGSLAAGSFTNYGTAVKPDNIQPGDIGVVRGRSPRTGIEGTHVGFLTGETRQGPRGLEAQMLSGNESDQVKYAWRPVSALHLRRAPAPAGGTAAQSQELLRGGGGGAEYLRQQRAPLTKQLADNPQLKKELAALGTLEHENDATAVVESLYNRTVATNEARAKRGLPPLSLSQMMKGGFYGPINKGLLQSRVAQLERDPARMKKMYGAIDAASSSNLLKGATDQGSGSDPNVAWPGGKTVRYGETYNDWGGGAGHEGNRMFRERQQAAIAQAERTKRIDGAVNNAAAGATKAEGSVNVTVNSNGTAAKTKAEANGGLWMKTTIENYRQMQPTSKPAQTVDQSMSI